LIPVRLELRNFMPYREPEPLDFSGVHVACLAGDNGAGKSALLDAITWALWGKARARTDNELIHLGQSEMEVVFTFRLGPQHYRVIRRRRISARGGQTLLDLQVRHGPPAESAGDGKTGAGATGAGATGDPAGGDGTDGDGTDGDGTDGDGTDGGGTDGGAGGGVAPVAGGWRSLAEATVRETQAKIEQLLRLDYDTFINSAFLVQGRADEFTTRTPTERKRVLSEILGLQLWDAYEERAKQRVAELARQIEQLDGQVAEYEAEIAQRERYEQELHAAQEAVVSLSAELHLAEAAYGEDERTRQALDHTRRRLADHERRATQAAGEVAEAGRELGVHQDRLATVERLQAERQTLEAGYARYRESRAADDALNERLREHSTLLAERARLDARLAALRADSEAERRLLARQADELARRLPDPAREAELVTLRAELAAAEERARRIEELRERRHAAAGESAALLARVDALKTEANNIKDRRRLLAEASTPACPVCGQPLAEAQRAELVAGYDREVDDRRADYRDLGQRARALNDEVAALEREGRALQGEQSRLGELQRREAQLVQQLQAASAAAVELAELQTRLAALDAYLAAGEYGRSERAALDELLARMAALGYDAAAHDALRAQLRELHLYELRWNELQGALAGLEETRALCAAAQARLERAQASLAEEQAAQAGAQVECGRLLAALDGAEARAQLLARLRADEALARQKLGAAQQKIAACEQLVGLRARRLKERNELATRQGEFAELQLAFGKKGVPAMIIEAAIPEIEEAANALLGRMTANRMHVRLETQREKVTGGLAETLDIKISDELGTRDYALYSGGEAYRVNFAVRIGLSRLLARRAGAQLQLLVLDEGFGTLDTAGREQLIEAINAVQDDFGCILVITHIEELRDVFPTRIEVRKTAEGSVLQVA
jgi:exonuclease SbcC